MTDKGYDSQANRAAARARGITPVIPRRENSTQRGRFFPKRLYKLRARIEQAIGKLKRFKRVAMRCEKTDTQISFHVNSKNISGIILTGDRTPRRLISVRAPNTLITTPCQRHRTNDCSSILTVLHPIFHHRFADIGSVPPCEAG